MKSLSVLIAAHKARQIIKLTLISPMPGIKDLLKVKSYDRRFEIGFIFNGLHLADAWNKRPAEGEKL